MYADIILFLAIVTIKLSTKLKLKVPMSQDGSLYLSLKPKFKTLV